MLNAAERELADTEVKLGMEGSTCPSLLRVRNIIEHLPCVRYFEKG